MTISIVAAAFTLVAGGLHFLRYRAIRNFRREVLFELQSQNPAYYANLPAELKRDFKKRLFRFVQQKEFVPRGNLSEVSTAMQVSIATCAVQLTFGLKPIYLSHFRAILIYPDRYYSTISKQYHCGEVNMRGCIVLSWKDFEKGLHHATDGFHLGLHEMAHALHLENIIRNDEYLFLNRHGLKQWEQLALQEMQRSQQSAPGFLRLQSNTDSHEFFAVCVESFFERPKDFMLTHPQLYNTLAQLLQQDPLKGIYKMGNP